MAARRCLYCGVFWTTGLKWYTEGIRDGSYIDYTYYSANRRCNRCRTGCPTHRFAVCYFLKKTLILERPRRRQRHLLFLSSVASAGCKSAVRVVHCHRRAVIPPSIGHFTYQSLCTRFLIGLKCCQSSRGGGISELQLGSDVSSYSSVCFTRLHLRKLFILENFQSR